MGIAALILGIFSLLSGILEWFVGYFAYLGLAAGIVGIILGAKNSNPAQQGMATTGKILSIIGTVLCALGVLIVAIACIACASVGYYI